MLSVSYRIIVIFAVIFLTACSEGVPTYTMEVVDGINVIDNFAFKWGDDSKVKLEFVQKIGGLDEEDEEKQLFRPADVVVNSKGDIFVLDAGNNRVVKYSGDGNHEMSFANEGQGPGELRNPNELALDKEGNIYVSDSGNSRIQVFDKRGKYLSGTKEKIRPTKFVHLHSGANAIFHDSYTGNLDTRSLVTIIDQNGDKLRSFVRPKYFKDLQMKVLGNSYTMINDNDDNLYTVFRYQNRVEKYNSTGELLWRSNGLLEDEEVDNFTAKTAKDSNGEDKQVLIFVEFFKGVALDENGRIWVSTMSRQPTDEEVANRSTVRFGPNGRTSTPKVKDPDENIYKFDIYDENGILLGYVQIDQLDENIWISRNSKFRIFKSRLFIIDPETEMAVYEYKIIG